MVDHLDNDSIREALLQMRDSEGWSLVEKYISSRIEDHEKQLLTCPLDEVSEHRAKREAYRSVLLYITENVEE